MTCDKCPALIIESNENVYPSEFHCWYGDKYRDEHLEYFANLNEGCRKHLTTIERDMFGVKNDKKINK